MFCLLVKTTEKTQVQRNILILYINPLRHAHFIHSDGEREDDWIARLLRLLRLPKNANCAPAETLFVRPVLLTVVHSDLLEDRDIS